MSGTWRVALLSVLPVLLISTGCAAARPDAAASVTRFYEAYRQHDGARACALLTPAARKEVAAAAHDTCARGVVAEKLPRPGAPRSTKVFGDQAQVRMGGDTAFVARVTGRWQVRAIGCTRRQDAPYECEVEDGG
jgi:hypothetical protein